MATYCPFSSERQVQLTSLLGRSAVSIEQFLQLRRELSGQALTPDGIRMLVENEPKLAGRLSERIFPSIVRHARALLAAGKPALSVHEAGRPARTVVSRAE